MPEPSPPDLYARLGVEPTATASAIKAAYRQLARAWHPDKNPGDAEASRRFREVSEAYRVLGEPESRARYDRESRPFAPEDRLEPADGAQQGFRASQVVDQVFGRRGAPKAQMRGDDYVYHLKLGFEEAVLGCEKRIELPGQLPCERCHGTGAAPDANPVICGRCAGRGEIQVKTGFFSEKRPCEACQGRGRRVDKPCLACGGLGLSEGCRSLSVSVPPGSQALKRLRMAGYGQQGPRRGPAGDLLIHLEVAEHPWLRVEGHDVVLEMPIAMTLAAVGGKARVPTLEGLVEVAIPKGVRTGEVLRLPGFGVPQADRKMRGDQRVRFFVETPELLSSESVALMKQLETVLEAPSKGSKLGQFLSFTSKSPDAAGKKRGGAPT